MLDVRAVAGQDVDGSALSDSRSMMAHVNVIREELSMASAVNNPDFNFAWFRYSRTSMQAASLMAVLAVVASAAAAADDRSSRDQVFTTHVRSFLDQYCVDCHMDGSAEAGVVLDSFRNRSEALGGGRTWIRVLDALEGGIMPPDDAAQPETQEVQHVLHWIENDFLSRRPLSVDGPLPVVIRRLNRREYDNTIRDLIGLDLQLASDFPADDIGFGFDNIGSALNTSPAHIEKYLDAAERIAEAAIILPDVEAFSPAELIGLRTYPLPSDQAVEFEHHLSPGRYLADFSLVRVGIAESVPPPRLVIGFGSDFRTLEAVRVQDETVVYRYWLTVAEGDDTVSVKLAPGQSDSANVVMPEEATANVSGDQRYGGNRGLHVDSMVVRGPVVLDEEKLSESHRRLVFCRPGFGDASRMQCGQRIVARFAERAFRRPVLPSEVSQLARLFQSAIDHGESFERAVQVAVTAVLVSPRFLYLVEPDATEGDRALSDFELASRLSYFLWSTMPDEDLRQHAADGTLRRNLRPIVAEMLADSRSESFVENFTGQWLQLRLLEGVAPDGEQFPVFNDDLRAAMRQETELFFADILRSDRSVLELLRADYTFANDVLARHYELSDSFDESFRRVALPDSRRGGVLTQASILTLTSHQNRTSPVKRGQWILQQLLGTPPPPPPPDVADLDESAQAAESASLRERLELHRSNPECASCHSQMDPLGFALENYDAIGRWRTMDGDFEIDPSGELPGGLGFDDAAGLKALLSRRAAKRFCRCLIENMLTYALGRGLDPADYSTVEAIRRRLVADEYRFQSIVIGIVESNVFQQRGVVPKAPTALSGL